MGWAWNGKAGRYYDTDTGRFLSNARALELIQADIDFTAAATDRLAGYVSEGLISPDTWREAMRREIKLQYTRQYELGIGGRGRMLPRDWGSVGGMIQDQYRYLDGFYADLDVLSEAQIRARSRMYVNSAREAYERAHGRVAEGLGYTEVQWILGPVLTDHCPDCEARQGMGWQVSLEGGFPTASGPSWPGDGSTVCLTNCNCSLEHRDPATGEMLERATEKARQRLDAINKRLTVLKGAA
jgi:hypothetical protein